MNQQIIESVIGKKPAEYQMSIFEVALESFIDMNHELVLLSNLIDWDAVESEFVEPIEKHFTNVSLVI